MQTVPVYRRIQATFRLIYSDIRGNPKHSNMDWNLGKPTP